MLGLRRDKPNGRLVTLLTVCDNKENEGILAMKNYYDSNDVKKLLDLNSIRTAQYRIQAMNEELKEQGYWIERGKVPVKFFENNHFRWWEKI